jgi:hypothetical protein
MSHEPLVELILSGHEDGERLLPLAARTTHLLAHRCDRSWEPVEDAGIEATDVDAELERGGRNHTPEPAAEQLAFDLSSLFG